MYDSPPPLPRNVSLLGELSKQYAKPAMALMAAALFAAFMVMNWQAHRETQERIAALSSAVAAKPADPAPQTAALPASVPAQELPTSAQQAAFAEPKMLPPIQTAQPPVAAAQPVPTMPAPALAPPTMVVPAAGMMPAREPERFSVSNRSISTTDVLVIEAALRDLRTNQTDRIPLQLGGNEFAVSKDGSVSLGGWGTVSVAGLTPEKAGEMIRHKLAAFAQAKGADAAGSFLVSVEVKTPPAGAATTAAAPGPPMILPTSEVKPAAPPAGKACYVIIDTGANGEQVIKVPFSGAETAVDAIASAGFANDAGRRTIYLLRKGPAGTAQQALPVDWNAIVQRGDTKTNYVLQAEDRVYVSGVK